MQAIREIVTIEGNRITVNLPDDFESQRAEIIVLPYPEEPVLEEKDICGWKKDFLSISQWEAGENAEEVNSWKIQEF